MAVKSQRGGEVGTVSEIIVLHDSKRIPLSSQQREKMEKKYPYYGATSLMDYVDHYLFDGIFLLLGEDGTVVDSEGFLILQYVEGKFWVNNHAHILTGKNGFSVEMLYLLFSLTNVKDKVTGAVQQKISQGNLNSISTIIPPEEVCKMFDLLIKSLFALIRNLKQENEKNPSKNFYAYTLKDEIKINDGFDKAIYDNGTILSINLFDEKTNKSLFSNLEKEKDNIYFRFRIKNVDFKEILCSFEPTTKSFQNYFYTTYTIDFRFNNKRSLGDNLLQQINLYDRFVIESVHFLLITKTSVNLLTTEECSPRKLEKDIWNDYIDNENTDNLIAYHYKKSFKNKDTGEINYNNEAVDFFIKYDVGKSIFWKYFWLTILIGSVGSILGNVIWNLPSWICKLIQCFQ